ncbi:MAG: hypothetical protein ACWA5U_03215 [bacterium]
MINLNRHIIDLENGNYAFSDYFKMNITARDLCQVFGYHFEKNWIDFKSAALSNELKSWVKTFSQRLFAIQNKINLNSEMAKREFLIAPIIQELVQHLNIEVDIEANIHVNQCLKGNIDYILNNQSAVFIAIEAKNAEIEKGVTQLSSELIAIDHLLDVNRTPQTSNNSPFIYGAVTIGFAWCFVVLDRNEKIITQHIDYITIKELEVIVGILVGILQEQDAQI